VRLLVCGARDYADREYLFSVLDAYEPVADVVIEGEAKGADTLAREWAEANAVPIDPYPADWERYYRAAGPIRNQRMLDEGKPDLVLAFHDDIERSRGTKDMVARARKAGVPVRVLKPWARSGR
jgi:hypothetical protein